MVKKKMSLPQLREISPRKRQSPLSQIGDDLDLLIFQDVYVENCNHPQISTHQWLKRRMKISALWILGEKIKTSARYLLYFKHRIGSSCCLRANLTHNYRLVGRTQVPSWMLEALVLPVNDWVRAQGKNEAGQATHIFSTFLRDDAEGYYHGHWKGSFHHSVRQQAGLRGSWPLSPMPPDNPRQMQAAFATC